MLSARKKDRDSKSKQSVTYQHQVTSLIAGRLAELENKIIQKKSERSSQGKEDKKELFQDYKKELFKVAARLSRISSLCFHSTEIDNAKNYKDISLAPSDYKRYLKTHENLADLITDDINSQQDSKHAAFHMERWIYIAKLCFESHDYFSANAIISGLSANTVDKNLVNWISDTAQSALWYCNQFCLNLSKLQILQYKQSENGNDVIPLLTTLTNALASAEVTAENNVDDMVEEAKDKGEPLTEKQIDQLLKDEKAKSADSCKAMYVKMKNNSKKTSIEVDTLTCLQNQIDFPSVANKPANLKKVNINKIIKDINIYTNEDDFYSYADKLSKLKKEFNDCFEKFTGLYKEVNAILEKDSSDPDKLISLKMVLENNKNDTNKKALGKCEEMIKALEKLSEFNLKKISLETKSARGESKESPERKVIIISNENNENHEEEKQRVRSAPVRLTRSVSRTFLSFTGSDSGKVTNSVASSTSSTAAVINSETTPRLSRRNSMKKLLKTNSRANVGYDQKNVSGNITNSAVSSTAAIIILQEKISKPETSCSNTDYAQKNASGNITNGATSVVKLSIPEQTQKFFRSERKKLNRAKTHAPEEIKRSSCSFSFYATSQLPGLLLIDDEKRAAKIKADNELKNQISSARMSSKF